MKARIPSHREFIINFPDSVDQAKANEGWAKLQQIVEDYKKAHNGASVYAPTFIEDCEPAVKKLQEEYGFEYKDLAHGLAVAGVGRDAVDRLGRQGYQLALPQKLGCAGNALCVSRADFSIDTHTNHRSFLL